MKRVFFMVVSLLGAGIVQAQVKEGTVIYERKVNMHRTIQDEQMRAMIPEFRTSKHLLQFSDSVSIYKLVPEDEAPDPFAGGGGGVRMVFRGGADAGELYKNFSQARSVQSNELAGKNYLIVDAIQQQPWKMGTETKQVLGYTCHKATRKIMQPVPMLRTMSMTSGGNRTDSTSRPQTREVEVVAWFADDIISPVGPESYGQLPGVILELDIDNGQTVYTATEVKKSVDIKDLKEPKKGKTVTRDEYNKLQADMMNSQMQGMPGGVRFRMN
jgi:GLPGLI family protein